jgi:hypothetical protein
MRRDWVRVFAMLTETLRESQEVSGGSTVLGLRLWIRSILRHCTCLVCMYPILRRWTLILAPLNIWSLIWRRYINGRTWPICILCLKMVCLIYLLLLLPHNSTLGISSAYYGQVSLHQKNMWGQLLRQKLVLTSCLATIWADPRPFHSTWRLCRTCLTHWVLSSCERSPTSQCFLRA